MIDNANNSDKLGLRYRLSHHGMVKSKNNIEITLIIL